MSEGSYSRPGQYTEPWTPAAFRYGPRTPQARQVPPSTSMMALHGGAGDYGTLSARGRAYGPMYSRLTSGQFSAQFTPTQPFNSWTGH